MLNFTLKPFVYTADTTQLPKMTSSLALSRLFNIVFFFGETKRGCYFFGSYEARGDSSMFSLPPVFRSLCFLTSGVFWLLRLF